MARAPKADEPPRRKRGTGSRTKRPDGRWQCQWRGPEGRLSWTVDSLAQADAELDRLVDLRERGLTSDPRAEPLGAYLERWLPKRLRGRAPSTQKRLRHEVLRWAPLAGVSVGLLDPRAIDDLSWAWLEAGAARRTVLGYRQVLHAALGELVPGVLGANPVGPLKLPREQKKRPRAWSAAQVALFLDRLRGDPYHPLYLLVLATGLREGEVVALEWEDVEPDYRAIRVWRGTSLDRPSGVKDREERRVEIDEAIGAELRRHRARQAPGTVPVFPSPDPRSAIRGGRYTTSALRKQFRRHARRLGLPEIGFHGLRHTFATLQLAGGQPLAVVSEMLGHADRSFTAKVYWWVLPGQQRRAAAHIAGVLLGPSGGDQQRDRQRSGG